MCSQCRAVLKQHGPEELVENGIQWMNKYADPNWMDQINLEILDINDGNRCILGQAYDLGYDAGHAKMLQETNKSSAYYGMAGDYSGTLTNAWRNRIQQERYLAVNA